MRNLFWMSSYSKSGNTWMQVFIEDYVPITYTPVFITVIHNRALAGLTDQ